MLRENSKPSSHQTVLHSFYNSFIFVRFFCSQMLPPGVSIIHYFLSFGNSFAILEGKKGMKGSCIIYSFYIVVPALFIKLGMVQRLCCDTEMWLSVPISLTGNKLRRRCLRSQARRELIWDPTFFLAGEQGLSRCSVPGVQTHAPQRASPTLSFLRAGLSRGHSAGLPPPRLPECAGEPQLEGTLVPPEVQHSVFPQGPHGPSGPRECHRPPRLWGGPRLWTQTPICLQDPAQPAGGGHLGSKRGESLMVGAQGSSGLDVGFCLGALLLTT